MLSVHNLTTGYGKKKIIDSISFNVKKGELILLTGGNGSGKSTILKALYGLLYPWKNEDNSNGEIIFEGNKIPNISTANLLKLGIVYMQQKNNVFNEFSVNENLLIASSIYEKKDSQSRVDNIYNSIPQLAFFKNRTPFSMSGGERQLLAFGCVLLHGPKLMLLDEPFAGIDDKYSQLILSEIQCLRKRGTAFIIIEHNEHLFEHIEYKKITLNLGTIK